MADDQETGGSSDRQHHRSSAPQRRVLRGLGLHGIGTSVVVENTPSFRGMIKKVLHLVEVREEAS